MWEEAVLPRKKIRPKFIPFGVGGGIGGRRVCRKRSQISRPTQEKVFQARQSKKEKGGKDGGISSGGGAGKKCLFFVASSSGNEGVRTIFPPVMPP